MAGPDPKPADPPKPAPPLVVFLPGKGHSAKNSAARVAALMAIKASKGPGTFAVEDLISPGPNLTDAHRIVRIGAGPVLDVAMVDYRPRLDRSEAEGEKLGPLLRRLAALIGYLGRLVLLLRGAVRRAKGRIAKFQVGMGVAAVALFVVSVGFTVAAILVAVGVVNAPKDDSNAADGVAITFTAITSWAWFKARPAVSAATTNLRQLLDYADEERHAATVGSCLGSALDDALEATPDRQIHIVGYSLGALVALDFCFPRKSMREPLDPRHRDAIKTLVTIGCPVDFVRLYFPKYVENRAARVPGLAWTNVFIAADVLGSNLISGDDAAEVSTAEHPALQIADENRTSYRYTDERLTYLKALFCRGFVTHGGYWDEPESENCLHLALQAILPPAP